MFSFGGRGLGGGVGGGGDGNYNFFMASSLGSIVNSHYFQDQGNSIRHCQ